jgi:hypothetical protein
MRYTNWLWAGVACATLLSCSRGGVALPTDDKKTDADHQYDRLLKKGYVKPRQDKAGAKPADITVYHLKRVSADTVAKLVADVFRGQKNVQMRVLADHRTNSLIIQAEKETVARVKRILDVIEEELRKVDEENPVKPKQLP